MYVMLIRETSKTKWKLATTELFEDIERAKYLMDYIVQGRGYIYGIKIAELTDVRNSS